MSYIQGTALGHLRELVGDISDDELFTDDQLNYYLAQCNNSLGYAAARTLRRIANDLILLRRKYSDFGRMDAATMASFQRNLLDIARGLEESEMSAVTPVDIDLDTDVDEAGISTDSEGYHRITDLDTNLLDQETKR